MTTTTPAALTIDTLDFRKLLADLIDASGRGDDEYMPVRMKFIAFIDAKLTAASQADGLRTALAEVTAKLERVAAENLSLNLSNIDLRAQLAAQEPAPATQQGDETIQRLAELHFYAPDADSMDIRLHRFARALLANVRATQQAEPAAAQQDQASDEPVAWVVDWHDIGEGVAQSFFYGPDAKEHKDAALRFAFKSRNRTATVTALAPAQGGRKIGMDFGGPDETARFDLAAPAAPEQTEGK